MSSSLRLPIACVAVALALAAGVSRAGTDVIFGNGFEPPPPPTFVVTTPTATIGPGEEVSYCFYFRTPNAATIGVRRLESTLSVAASALFVYATYSGSTPTELQPPGTFTTTNCGAGGGGSGTFSKRIYQTQLPTFALQMPSSDGAGVPLAIELLAAQPLYMEVHFLNASDSPVSGSAQLAVFALPTATPYTRTAAYMTYNGDINIPAMSTGTASANCAVPASTKFWWFSTQTHRFATSATLRNGAQTLVVSTDWQNPAIAQFGPPSFYQFAAAERLTYECTYNNNLSQTIRTGDSWATDENCIGLAYFFPATTPLLCFNNFGPF
ncbi:MAG TPA: hypothetical protein VFL14_07200 [Xanthomonadales bacterium]|nr:hypothetical protein [Xanthomonadales bacterium]